jgi:hypothetical protein
MVYFRKDEPLAVSLRGHFERGRSGVEVDRLFQEFSNLILICFRAMVPNEKASRCVPID